MSCLHSTVSFRGNSKNHRGSSSYTQYLNTTAILTTPPHIMTLFFPDLIQGHVSPLNTCGTDREGSPVSRGASLGLGSLLGAWNLVK